MLILAIVGCSRTGLRVDDFPNDDAARPAPQPTSAAGRSLAVGDFHACAIVDGDVLCWGSNAQGQIGNGAISDAELLPTRVAGLSQVLELATGPSFDLGVGPEHTRQSHTCARRVDGTVWCWGPNVDHETDIGTTASRHPTPTKKEGIAAAAQIAIGQFHSCVLITDGTVGCWGDGVEGQLGEGASAWRREPMKVSGIERATQIAAGQGYTCALVDGSVRCWGRSAFDDPRIESAAPRTVDGLDDVVQISGATSVMARMRDGRVARLSNMWTPEWTSVSGASHVAGRAGHACIVTSSHTVQCFGTNFAGQLGIGMTSPGIEELPPTRVPGLGAMNAIEVAYWTTCARGDRDVWCWGGCTGGCGDGTPGTHLSPVRVAL